MRRAPERSALLLLLLALAAPRLVGADTNAADVAAINGLYVALGSPTLPGWTGNGGDPCGELWQGVTCTGSSIIGITMNAANLGGQLGSLGKFTAITTIFFRRSASWSNCPARKPVRVEEIPSYPPVRMEQQPRVVCCTGSLRDLLHPICGGHGGYFVLNL